MHKYSRLIYWSDEDEAFIAEVPELPGCATHGDTYSAALANAGEAEQLWLDTAKEFGKTIPEPKGRPINIRRAEARPLRLRKNQPARKPDIGVSQPITNPRSR